MLAELAAIYMSALQAPWQHSAVKGYLKQTSKLPPQSKFNASGRAYPDISAVSATAANALTRSYDRGSVTLSMSFVGTGSFLLNTSLFAMGGGCPIPTASD